jgi:acyl carrier protein
MDDRAIIREFIQNLLRKNGDEAGITDNEQLITDGRLQSIDTLEVLLFLEEKYGLDFGESGFDQNQVESIDSIIELIANWRT